MLHSWQRIWALSKRRDNRPQQTDGKWLLNANEIQPKWLKKGSETVTGIFFHWIMHNREDGSFFRIQALFVKLQITNWLWERYSRHCLFMVYLWLLLPFRLSFSFLKEKGSFHLCKEWLCKWFFISCSYLHRSINSAINFKRTVIPIKFVVFLGQVLVTGFYHGSNPYNQTQVVNYTQNTGQF